MDFAQRVEICEPVEGLVDLACVLAGLDDVLKSPRSDFVMRKARPGCFPSMTMTGNGNCRPHLTTPYRQDFRLSLERDSTNTDLSGNYSIYRTVINRYIVRLAIFHVHTREFLVGQHTSHAFQRLDGNDIVMLIPRRQRLRELPGAGCEIEDPGIFLTADLEILQKDFDSICCICRSVLVVLYAFAEPRLHLRIHREFSLPG